MSVVGDTVIPDGVTVTVAVAFRSPGAATVTIPVPLPRAVKNPLDETNPADAFEKDQVTGVEPPSPSRTSALS